MMPRDGINQPQRQPSQQSLGRTEPRSQTILPGDIEHAPHGADVDELPVVDVVVEHYERDLRRNAENQDIQGECRCIDPQQNRSRVLAMGHAPQYPLSFRIRIVIQ